MKTIRPITEEERQKLNAHPGRVDGPEPADEREHFYSCSQCGQAVDMRKLGDVIYHEAQGHKPIPAS